MKQCFRLNKHLSRRMADTIDFSPRMMSDSWISQREEEMQCSTGDYTLSISSFPHSGH